MIRPFLKCSEFREDFNSRDQTVGGLAEAAIGGVIETIDNIINRIFVLIAKWSP
jgi:hypothetical protein